MILDNYIIKQDLLEIEKSKKSKTFIFLYIIIILLLIIFTKIGIKEFVFLDLYAGIFSKITISLFIILLIESFILSIKKYKQVDPCIQENLWKVEEHNLTSKKELHSKFLFIFTGNYEYEVGKELYNKTKIGERFYIVLKDVPCGRLTKYKKKVLNIYHKDLYEKYNNQLIKVETHETKKITNKYIEKILFSYNLPDTIEINLISGVTSCLITTIFQVVKQQYFTYFSDVISFILLFVLFIFILFLLISYRKEKLKRVSIENCVLVEEKNNYSLLGKYQDKYTLIYIFPKSKYLDMSDNINKKREI